MSRYLSEQKIEEVREAADIVSTISEYLPLKKAGANYKACCPFHTEKTPSFSVNPNRQIFKCFGCGKAGNVFHFLMAISGLTFPEAVRKLAQQHGIWLDDGEDDTQHSSRRDVLSLLEWSATYYQNCLQQSQGEKARDYLAFRKISRKMQQSFRLGFAPAKWEELTQAAKHEGFSTELLEQAGLISESRKQKNKYYDKFRNRLIFPICNVQGQIIAFGGRTLEANGKPKYLNSPETSFFSKKKVLYALNFARKKAEADQSVLVMEGYTDVLMAHQYGFSNAIATLGTSLTQEHTQIIGRYAKSAVLVFDGDKAGQKAAERSLGHFLKHGLMLRIAMLPQGQDPFDFLQQQGADNFSKVIINAEDFLDFQIRKIAQKYDLQETTSRRYAVNEISKTIAYIPDIITQRLVLNKVGEIFRVSIEVILSTIKVKERKTPITSPTILSCREKFQQDEEKFLLWVAMHYPQKNTEIFQHYPWQSFTITLLQKLAKCICDYWQQMQKIEIASLATKLEPTLAEKLINIYYTDYRGLDEETINERLGLIFKGQKRLKYKAKFNKLKEILSSGGDEELKSQILHDARILRREQDKEI